MQKIRRILALLLATLMLGALLCACGAAAKEPELSAIVEAVDAAVDEDNSLVAVDEAYVAGLLQMDVSAYADWCVKINAYGANVDEYGVFKGSDAAQAKEIQQEVESYLQRRVDTWMEEYMPEEKPKVTSAEIVTQGNYVFYAILSEEDKDAAFAAFEDCFK